MDVRLRIEGEEAARLSEFAARAGNSRGRARPEPECPLRTCYMRDRDRIMHQAKSFRRLAHKTQVFVSPAEDHYRTRLSHTLEVAQIARTIARALSLNEDLTEAIALAHDLGHAPYGHAGEEGLDDAYRRHGGRFHHAPHSLRVVDHLENDGVGLNLTFEVRNGILSHTKGRTDWANSAVGSSPATVEAQVVRVSDRIAYLNHDIDDALRAGVMALDDLPADALDVLGRGHGQRIDTMVHDVVARSLGQPAIGMSTEVAQASDAVKEHLYDHVYLSATAANADRGRIKALLGALFEAHMAEPERLPRPHPALDLSQPADRARAVADHLAGMSDRYAKDTYLRLFLPRDWQGA
ncbi:MAG: deoxyguanosinetriphosphate triphosphohydrolase [Armatimonadetes bacterium]|nr:deoxyguanosinetriphosphate triphosphohydrolase [Armatimonadota bacterium]